MGRGIATRQRQNLLHEYMIVDASWNNYQTENAKTSCTMQQDMSNQIPRTFDISHMGHHTARTCVRSWLDEQIFNPTHVCNLMQLCLLMQSRARSCARTRASTCAILLTHEIMNFTCLGNSSAQKPLSKIEATPSSSSCPKKWVARARSLKHRCLMSGHARTVDLVVAL